MKYHFFFFSLMLLLLSVKALAQSNSNIHATKMNVLYIGTDNVLEYNSYKADPKTLKLSCEGCDSIKPIFDNMAKIWVSKRGFVSVKLEGKDISFIQSFRVKNCPNPTVKLLTGQKNGLIKAELFQQQKGILPILEDFDFDIRCTIVNYKLTRYRSGEITSSLNESNYFNQNTLELIKNAQKGDLFTITELQGKCTGDTRTRTWESLVFYIE